MSEVSNLDLWASLVGTLLPALVAAINANRWAPEQKAVVAAVISVAAGFVTAYLSGYVTPDDVLRSVLIVFTLGQITHATFWRPSGIAETLERGDRP